MSFSVRCAAVLASILGVLAITGCGETVIDSVKAEGTIKSELEKALHEKITAVSCPSGQEVDPGTTFDCTVDFSNDKQATATLKILNKDADVSLVGLKANK